MIHRKKSKSNVVIYRGVNLFNFLKRCMREEEKTKVFKESVSKWVIVYIGKDLMNNFFFSVH